MTCCIFCIFVLFQAAIVGYHTRQVLYFGVKNKYCVTCARKPENKNHTCFKNWNGSSSSMEAATIVEGFLTSEEMYNVQYARMIADGDSSVYNSILEARPYKNLTVKKIECRNHMLRNYCNKLKDVATTSVHKEVSNVDRGLHLKMRRILGGRS
uniref:Mutator-like transposase domain-containing protein n=1 Tax=Graphocephala atropunctata TaxID=36148 RepID=A0A1B6MAV4_9HEMI